MARPDKRKGKRVMTDREIATVCLLFRSELLNGRGSEGMCGVVCFPLQGFLGFHGIETTLMASAPRIGDWAGHLWLRLPDGRALDPTADQYGDDRPAIYIGEPDADIHCNAKPFRVEESHSLQHALGGKRRATLVLDEPAPKRRGKK